MFDHDFTTNIEKIHLQVLMSKWCDVLIAI